VKAEEKITREQNARRGWGTSRGQGQSYVEDKLPVIAKRVAAPRL